MAPSSMAMEGSSGVRVTGTLSGTIRRVHRENHAVLGGRTGWEAPQKQERQPKLPLVPLRTRAYAATASFGCAVRSSRRRILPIGVFGSGSVRNSTIRGTL
jgi:hypothetical protein